MARILQSSNLDLNNHIKILHIVEYPFCFSSSISIISLITYHFNSLLKMAYEIIKPTIKNSEKADKLRSLNLSKF